MNIPWTYDVVAGALTLETFDSLPKAQDHLRDIAFQLLASGDYEYVKHMPNQSVVRRIADSQEIAYKIIPRTETEAP